MNSADQVIPPDHLVSHVAIAVGDVENAKVRLIPHGDEVAGFITLDNCGYHFTTEVHRTARRQVVVELTPRRKVSLSNEVVAYESPAFAAEALNELRTSVKTCPKNQYRDSRVKGTPDLRYDVSRLRSSSQLPVQDNTVATMVVRARKGNQRLHELVIVQRHGTVLSLVYLMSLNAPSKADRATAMTLAKISGQRLANAA